MNNVFSRCRARFTCTPLALVWFLYGFARISTAATFDIRIASEFAKIVDTNQTLWELGSGYGWIEGPVWVPQQGGYFVFTEQTNTMYRWAPGQGVTVFRSPSHNANGDTLDLNERLITCETDTRRVVMTDSNGVVTILVDRYNGLTFNAPNDVVVKSDGSIWFTDPNYGRGQTQPGRYVYRFYPSNGNATVTAVVTTLSQPNGLCFSPDERLLYVADSDTFVHKIRVFDVLPDNSLANGRWFCTISNGVPDGMRCDVDGRLYSSAQDGVQVFLPDGRLVGKILVPNTTPNLCFGDADWRTLYIVAQPKFYSLRMKVAGTASMKKLSCTTASGQINLSWPAPSTGFQLESCEALAPTASWTAVSGTSTVTNGLNTVTLSATNPATFFRLRKAPPG